MGASEELPHSALYFDAVRDYWWNLDYLGLLVGRLGLRDVRSVLDVGAGVGHWGRALAAVLPSETAFVGIDSEPKWIEEATRQAEQYGLAKRARYQFAHAESLPFDDASFDLVTCQTLLIHVRDPRAVITEMLRVVRPGGWVLLAEPNNFAGNAIGSSLTAEAPIEEILDRLRFALTCERGKAALGEGHISLGDLLPGYLAEAGAEEIQTSLSDKAVAMFAPYETEEQREYVAAEIASSREQMWVWPREQARRYFLAGGGTEDGFASGWDRRITEIRNTVSAIAASTYHTAGGSILYLIAGKRPGEDGICSS
jgi:SAM-dependent methyltransferase